MSTEISIRVARADELETLVAIDDDATKLYPTAGVVIDLPPDHPWVLREVARWKAALQTGDVFVAIDAGEPCGMAVMGLVDGEPYLGQLSVKRAAMKRGLGSALIDRALGWARSRSTAGLWLDTYGHLPWTRPFYERRGFVVVGESAWQPEMRVMVEEQRESLPLPDQRIVMHHA